jgi:hypothetical protein
MDATPLIGLMIAPMICVIWLLHLWNRPERERQRGQARSDTHHASPDVRS